MSNTHTNNSARTAIRRKRPSQPTMLLAERGDLIGCCLDYGCGHGKDADEFLLDKFDPHHHPIRPANNVYDTVVCNYVLNVLPSRYEILSTLWRIRQCLNRTGVAYITVRTDKRSLRGWTKHNTWQGFVKLGLPVHCRGRGFITYRMTKTDTNPTVEIYVNDYVFPIDC